MDTENFLLTIGKNEIIDNNNFILSDVFHCVDIKSRPVSICNIKYDNKYLLLELPFLKVIKKEDNFIYLSIEDDNIKDELNNIDDILFKLIDDIENREDCFKEFNDLSKNELVYNTLLKTNEEKTYIKIYYNDKTNFINKEKSTSIFNVDINNMVQVILFIENIRIYTNDNFCILKNLAQQVVIHKPIKIYNSPKINLEKINTSYKEKNVFKKQVIEDVSKTIMEDNNNNDNNTIDTVKLVDVSNNNIKVVDDSVDNIKVVDESVDIIKVVDDSVDNVIDTIKVFDVKNSSNNVIKKEPVKRKPRVSNKK